tara:strand:+ start:824 stop:1747 length:924 start_codon:yes stop_codon:yes gene_type:complete
MNIAIFSPTRISALVAIVFISAGCQEPDKKPPEPGPREYVTLTKPALVIYDCAGFCIEVATLPEGRILLSREINPQVQEVYLSNPHRTGYLSKEALKQFYVPGLPENTQTSKSMNKCPGGGAGQAPEICPGRLVYGDLELLIGTKRDFSEKVVSQKPRTLRVNAIEDLIEYASIEKGEYVIDSNGQIHLFYAISNGHEGTAAYLKFDPASAQVVCHKTTEIYHISDLFILGTDIYLSSYGRITKFDGTFCKMTWQTNIDEHGIGPIHHRRHVIGYRDGQIFLNCCPECKDGPQGFQVFDAKTGRKLR